MICFTSTSTSDFSQQLSQHCSLIYYSVFVQERPIVDPGLADDNPSQAATSPSGGSLPELPNKDVNRRIAVFSTVAAVGLFISKRLDFGVSLNDLSALAVPYEEVCLFCYLVHLPLFDEGDVE